MADVVIINDEGGDWAALYIDGVLRDEDHSLEPDILEYLVGETVETFTQYSFDFLTIGKGYETLDEYTDLVQW